MARRHSQNSMHDLYQSLYHGNNELLTKYKVSNGDLNFRGAEGYTLLVKAIVDKDFDKVKLFLTIGCDVNKQDSNGNTPLLWSVRTSQKDITKLLLENRANVNKTNARGVIALTEAVLANDLESVSLLLENGADCNLADGHMKTPFFYSLQSNEDSDISKAIIESGKVRLNKQLMFTLSVGVDNIDVNYIDKLLQMGANPFESFQEEKQVFEMLIFGELTETDVYKGNFELKKGTILAPFIREYGFATTMSRKNKLLYYLITCELISKFYRFDVDHDISMFKLYIKNVINVLIKLFEIGLPLPSFRNLWRCALNCKCNKLVTLAEVNHLFLRKIKRSSILLKPVSLLVQCRTAVRCALRMNCSVKVKQLPVPDKIRDFLVFDSEM